MGGFDNKDIASKAGKASKRGPAKISNTLRDALADVIDTERIAYEMTELPGEEFLKYQAIFAKFIIPPPKELEEKETLVEALRTFAKLPKETQEEIYDKAMADGLT